MNVFGLDFTSAPSRRKPITCAACELSGDTLTLRESRTMPTFAEFEAFLRSEGPWLAALDFPFGQPRKLIANLGWPTTWSDYMRVIATMSKVEFEETLAVYRAGRPVGDKLHMRVTDTLAGARSPMMLHRVPVGKMFFQGAPRLLNADISILPCRPTTSGNIVVEGYPALVARKWLGKRGYKSDERGRQSSEQREARRDLIAGLCSPELLHQYGIHLSLTESMADALIAEPMGDLLDALLCAVQAAWVYTRRDEGYGIPATCDADEGCIVDPALLTACSASSEMPR